MVETSGLIVIGFFFNNAFEYFPENKTNRGIE